MIKESFFAMVKFLVFHTAAKNSALRLILCMSDIFTESLGESIGTKAVEVNIYRSFNGL